MIQRQFVTLPPYEMPRAGPPALVLLVLVALFFGFCEPYARTIEGMLDEAPITEADW